MNEYEEDRLENIELQPSVVTEKTLINLGLLLYQALNDASRKDEVEILIDAIGEFSTMASFYGIKTKRLEESLGVNLMEAALFKRDGSNEWPHYAEPFKNELIETARKLNIELPPHQ